MADLVLTNISRTFGAVEVLSSINLTVRDGEFVSLLGPSGCGKSTTLGLIAGLDRPSGGRIEIDGRAIVDAQNGTFVPAEQRNLGLVLQSYALWPHMTVEQNISLPLEIRRIPRAKRRNSIAEYLNFVEMDGYQDRYPHELSGGQQQRVALARTLVYEPILLLLDEPLSNVDAKLRERARSWLRQLQKRLGVTTIFVTHDQAEALTMSDRIAVMSDGRIVQYGTPLEVYRNPVAPFVADFVGSSNFLDASRLHTDGKLGTYAVSGTAFQVSSSHPAPAADDVLLAIRPERIGPLAPGQTADNELEVEILTRDFLGPKCVYHSSLGGQSLRFESGDISLSGRVRVGFNRDAVFAFLPDGGPK